MRSRFVGFSLFLAVAVHACASVDPGLLAMAPAEAVLLTGIDVARTQASPFGQYLLKRVNSEDAHFRQMTSATGFDPRRDLQQLMFVGLSTTGGASSRYVILARGTFDDARIEAIAKAHGAKPSTYEGTPILLQGQGNGASAISFPDAGVAVMGDVASVREVLARRSSPATLDPKLVDYANRVGSNNDVWFATLLAGGFLGRSFGDSAPQLQNSQALQSILQSAGGVQFGSTVTMTFDATTRSPQDAQALADVLRFASSLVQMQGANDPRAAVAASALQAMQLETNGSSVHATLGVTEDVLEQMLRSAPRRNRAPAGQ